MATWSTKQINDFPDSSFAYVEPGGTKDADGKTEPRSLRHLPYKDADGNVDLPHVRNALARLDQVQNLPDAKKAEIQKMLEDILAKAQTKSMADKAWHAATQIMAEGAQQLPSRIMLMKTGNWDDSWKGKLNITEADLQQYKDNFDKGIGVPGRGQTGLPIDFSHEDNKHAAGWIKGLEVGPSDDPVEAANGVVALYANPVEWSDAGKQALLGGLYKCISPSFFPAGRGGWEDPEDMSKTADNVLVGAGLTNIPFFAGLSPIMASNDLDKSAERDKNVVYFSASKNNKEGDNQMSELKLDEVRVLDADKLTDEQKQFLADNKKELSGEELKKFGLEADKTEPEVSDDDRQLLADIKSGKVKTVKEGEEPISAERVKQLEATAKKYETEKAEAIVESHIKRGAIKADQKERWTGRLLDASEEDRKALEEDLSALPSNEQIGKENGSESEGLTADTATAEMDKLAGEKVAAAAKAGQTLSYAEAVKQVNAERPDLYEATQADRQKSEEN